MMNVDNLLSELSRLNVEIETCQKQAVVLGTKRADLMEVIATEVSGVKKGDTVKAGADSFIVYRLGVVGNCGDSKTKPWLSGFKVLKDGTRGTREICLYDNWERIES
jgi:hypothetical protein